MKRSERHLTADELGAIGFESSFTMRRHLAACSTCRERLAQIEHVRNALASTKIIDLTPSRVLTDGALAQLHRQKAGVVKVNGMLSVIGAIFAAFAMLLPRHKASAVEPAMLTERDEHE